MFSSNTLQGRDRVLYKLTTHLGNGHQLFNDHSRFHPMAALCLRSGLSVCIVKGTISSTLISSGCLCIQRQVTHNLNCLCRILLFSIFPQISATFLSFQVVHKWSCEGLEAAPCKYSHLARMRTRSSIVADLRLLFPPLNCVPISCTAAFTPVPSWKLSSWYAFLD